MSVFEIVIHVIDIVFVVFIGCMVRCMTLAVYLIWYTRLNRFRIIDDDNDDKEN